MNYHFRLARYGYTFDQIIRIASRLAVKTGRARLAWVNHKGRAHIIAEGVGGYRHELIPPADRLHPNCHFRMVGQTPPHDSIDWQRGALVECTPTMEDTRPTPDDL